MKTIRINGKTYELTAITGKVLSAGKNMETRVSGSGGGGASFRGTGGNSSVSITSQTIIHDQIFLEASNGREYSFQLSDFNVACREGNILSVVFCCKLGKKKGYDISVINHTTRDIFFDTNTINRIAAPNHYLLILGFLLVSIFGFGLWRGDFLIMAGILLAACFAYYFTMLVMNTKNIKETIRPEDYAHEIPDSTNTF